MIASPSPNYSFKYFGKEQGVAVYTFRDERDLLCYSTAFSAAEQESAYVIDGLMHNEVVDLHDRLGDEIQTSIEHAKRLRIPSVICFSGNRDGLDDALWNWFVLASQKSCFLELKKPGRQTIA